MTGEYEEKKAAYDNLAAGLESNMSKLEQVIKIMIHVLLPLSLAFRDRSFISLLIYVFSGIICK